MTHEDLVALAHDNEQRSKSNQHRIDRLERQQKNLDNMVSTVAVIAEKQERMEKDLREIKSDVKALSDKPAKRWDGLINTIINVIAAAVAGFALARIGF